MGKYELGKTLGEGNFAKVKLAKNVDTGEFVAVKIFNRDNVLQHKMVEQIKREIATMKVIKHPNVVKLHEVMASKTKIYIVLELVDGGELFDIIAKQGRLKENEARKYFQQLINAVDYCHSRGVYHRDLKPENLLLDSYGVLKVADFGLSAFSQQVRMVYFILHVELLIMLLLRFSLIKVMMVRQPMYGPVGSFCLCLWLGTCLSMT